LQADRATIKLGRETGPGTYASRALPTPDVLDPGREDSTDSR
jgi:hypothetical protein